MKKCSLVSRPHPDFISQPWRKIGLQDKIWVGPGDEARGNEKMSNGNLINLGHRLVLCKELS